MARAVTPEGAKQKDELIKGIHELIAKRFLAEKSHLKVEGAMDFEAQALAIVHEQDSLNDLVKDGTITQAQADLAIQKTITKLTPKFTKVWHDLHQSFRYILLILKGYACYHGQCYHGRLRSNGRWWWSVH